LNENFAAAIFQIICSTPILINPQRACVRGVIVHYS